MAVALYTFAVGIKKRCVMKLVHMTQEEYVSHIRSCWKEKLGVINDEDLPYVLILEVIKISLLHKASFVRISYNARWNTIHIETNSYPVESRPDFQVGNYCGEPCIPYISCLFEREWGEGGEYAVINALCKRFAFVSGKRSIRCKDGEKVECPIPGAVYAGIRIVMTPFVSAPFDEDVVKKLLSVVSGWFKIKCEYKDDDCANYWWKAYEKSNEGLYKKMSREEYFNTSI